MFFGGTKKNQSLDKKSDGSFEIGGLRVILRTMPQDFRELDGKEEAKQETKQILSDQKTEAKDPRIETKEQSSRETLAKGLYKEAKSLYKQRSYQEAAEKFGEVLQIRKNHWRAKWFLRRAKKKAEVYYALQQKEMEEAARKLSEKISEKPTEEIAQPETLTEKEASPEEILTVIQPGAAPPAEKAEADRNEFETQISEEQQTDKIEAAIWKIKKEAEEGARLELSEKLRAEEEARLELTARIQKEEQERQRLAERIQAGEDQQKTLEAEIEKSKRTRSQFIPKAEVVFQKPGQTWQKQTEEHITPQAITTFGSDGQLDTIINNLKSIRALKILAVLVIILIAASGTVYWIGWKKTHPTEEPSAPPVTAEITPQSLFSVDETTAISLKTGQKKSLVSELEKLSKRTQEYGTFARILIKFTSEDNKQEYASLTDLIDAVRLSFPSEILSRLENNYTFFLYSQKEISSSPFAIGLGQNKLGVIIKIGNKENLSSNFLSWEKTMNHDLDTLFLGKKISFSDQSQFEEISYRNTIIRVLYLPNRFSCLNYAFYDNKVIISTSLETTQALIDKISPQQ